jgi:DNA-binding NarL/FixJ family response regulator
MITILIVDDHSIVREGLRSLLSAVHPDWKIFEAENGVQAILAASRIKPDLILMDHLMPKLDGIKAASVITRDLPATKIIMVTMSNKEEFLRGATDAGVKHFIPKNAPYSEILETITKFIADISQVRSKNQDKPSLTKNKKRKEKTDMHSLSLLFTDRELEVTGLILKGYPTKKISEYLGISKRTVEGHRFKIMKKCHVHSFPELLHFVVSNKMIPGS